MITVVNEWKFKKSGNKDEGLNAAVDLIEYFKKEEPGVRLSLWLQDVNDSDKYFHITVFESKQDYEKVRNSSGIEQFVDRLYPEVDDDGVIRSECEIILCNETKLGAINLI